MVPISLPGSRQPARSGWPGAGYALWRASRGKLVVLFLALCWAVGLAVGGVGQGRVPASDLNVAPGRSAVDVLVQGRDCWERRSPHPGAVPGHAVVATGTGAPRYVGRRGVRRALDQQFGGHPHGLTVYAFCR